MILYQMLNLKSNLLFNFLRMLMIKKQFEHAFYLILDYLTNILNFQKYLIIFIYYVLNIFNFFIIYIN